MIKMKQSGLFFSALVFIFTAGINQAEASVALGATRVIYPADQKQVSLGVSNNDDKSTFLIQSWVENANGVKINSFVITPPLFLMKGKKENTLRIIDGTNNSLAKDRETLFWLNVKAIPSMEKTLKDQNTLQFAIVSRIKLLYRPKGLSIAPEKAPSELRFSRSGSTLTVTNPTPYYITATNVLSNRKELKSFMVPPMGNTLVALPAGIDNTINYQTINDFGALTPTIQTHMN